MAKVPTYTVNQYGKRQKIGRFHRFILFVFGVRVR